MPWFTKPPLLALLLLCSQAGKATAEPPYQPTAESIAQHPTPEWFDDAKFGMFIDWGIYSVAGWAPAQKTGAMYPDWYLYRMYQDPATDPRSTKVYHEENWGKGFQRDDFIPLFTANAYDPAALIRLAKASGMKYVVPFAKHHDGFCLWPSTLTGRNAGAIGPKRDLIRPLVDAARQQGLKFGFYQSLDEWEYPLIGSQGEDLVRVWDTTRRQTRIEPYDPAKFAGKMAGKRPVRDYARDYLIPQTLEFVKAYDPDLIWFDGDWTEPESAFGTYRIVADYYNQAAGRKDVAVNDRLGKTRGKAGDFHCSEYGAIDMDSGKPFNLRPALEHKWEECRGISQSFGYNRMDTDANVLSAADLVHMLATIVSRNGNLLLVVNLDGDGALPTIERSRLQAIGGWLRVNGEAIYGTRPWQKSEDGRRLCFTRSKDSRALYAIAFDWPTGGAIVLHGVQAAPEGTVRMLGVNEPLKWRQESGDLRIEVPDRLAATKPCDYAYVFKVPLS